MFIRFFPYFQNRGEKQTFFPVNFAVCAIFREKPQPRKSFTEKQRGAIRCPRCFYGAVYPIQDLSSERMLGFFFQTVAFIFPLYFSSPSDFVSSDSRFRRKNTSARGGGVLKIPVITIAATISPRITVNVIIGSVAQSP